MGLEIRNLKFEQVGLESNSYPLRASPTLPGLFGKRQRGKERECVSPC